MEPINLHFCGFISCLLITIFLVLTKKWHGNFSIDSIYGVQKFHSDPTPRIGGISLITSFLITLIFIETTEKSIWFYIFISSLPVLLAGFMEDLREVGAINLRFLSAIVSALIFIYFTNFYLFELGIWGVDFLLQYKLIAIIFTSLCMCGIVNSINIIDGFNGLASGTSVAILIGFSIIGYSLGDIEISMISSLFASILIGFFLLNFPKGKIFLGDSGAYFLGFFISCLAVSIYVRNDNLSPWVCVLICAYPITETIFSMIRKIRRKGYHPGYPDRLHLHMLVYRDISRKISKKYFNNKMRNPLTSVLLWPFPILNVIGAISFYKSKNVIFLMLVIHLITYIIVYRKVSLNLKKIF